MDTKDVSLLSDMVTLMQQIQVNAERASRNKGRTPRNHPPPMLLIQRFMMKLNMRGGDMSTNRQTAFATSQVPAPYPPCTRPVAELRPIFISQMSLETHHRGRKVFVHVLTPPDRMTAVMAIVEDEEGIAIMLQVYHQPEEAVVPALQTLRTGRCYLLKEPFFKATFDGSYSLRVDHVSDIVLLDEDDGLLPAKWRKPKSISESSHDIRMRGNMAVGKTSWAEAEQLYTSAIQAAKTSEDDKSARLNRSLAVLKLGRPACALMDSVQAGGSGSAELTEKGLFREASSLYQLARFDQCLQTLLTLETTYPSSEAVKPLMDRVRTRLHEQQTGEYNWRQMFRQAKNTPPLIDCATYSTPVQVLESPGRGRGLFTTRKVVAGELLVCEKAFGYSYADEGQSGTLKILMNMSTKKMTVGGQADLLTQVVQKLYHDPEAARSFVNLHHGDYKASSVSEVDGRPVVDTFLVEKVISLTSFGAPRTTRAHVENMTSDKSEEKDSAFHTCGIWSLISHINHSCMSNCRRSFIGDMQIVRATKDLDAGTELFFWYRSPEAFESYNETQEHLRNWGFRCDCTLCLDKKSTPRDIMLKRRTLRKDLREAMGISSRTVSIHKAQRVLEQLEQTYSATARRSGAVRLELWDPYFALGSVLLAKDRPEEAIEMVLKGLESLGFVLTASPPRADVRSQGPQFQINHWGMATDWTGAAFLTLFQAYKRLAPDLSVAARRHMEIAYAMVVGEKETFLDMYPEL